MSVVNRNLSFCWFGVFFLSDFKIPFFLKNRNALAVDLLVDAKLAADGANKARSISGFIDEYDVLLECFRKLSLMDGKITSIKGSTNYEYSKFQLQFQTHLHDAIDRSSDVILESKDYYSAARSISTFWNDFIGYRSRFDKDNKRFFVERYFSICRECWNKLLCPHGSLQIKEFDSLLSIAVDVVFETNMVSASMLQRRMKLSFPRASQLISQMECLFIVEALCEDSVHPREILMQKADWSSIKNIGLPFTETPNSFIESLQPEPEISSIESELQSIDRMNGQEFENWCAYMLRCTGFSNVNVTAKSGDQGVDILAEKDGIKYAIQCKCYSADLGNTPVQEVNTGKTIYHCHVGVVMTNRHFTIGAHKAADATGVLLWDREKLVEMLENCICE